MWPFKSHKPVRRVQGEWTCMECAAFTLVIAAPTQMELQAKLDRQRAFHYADKHPDLPL